MSEIKIQNNETNVGVFASVKKLYDAEEANSGGNSFFNGLKITKVSKDAVELGDGRRYVLSDDAETNEGGTMGFDSAGAKWFATMRASGKKSQSPESEWAAVRDSIAKAYHKKYYVIRYNVTSTLTDKNEEECRAKIITVKNIFNRLAPEITSGLEVQKEDATCDTYYGVKLRVDISFGVGEQIPLIGRLYFLSSRASDNTLSFELLERSRANIIRNGFVANSVRENSGEATLGGNLPSGMVSSIFQKLTELVLREDIDKIFSDSVIFSDESLNTLLAQPGAEDGSLEIICNKISIISISQISWPIIAYKIMSENRPVLGVKYDLGGLTVTCENCARTSGKAAVLIRDDMLLDKSGQPLKSANGRLLAITGDEAKDKRLYSDSRLSETLLSEHLVAKPSCMHIVPMGEKCRKLVCKSELFTRGDKSSEKSFCKDCPYPEVVYMPDGETGEKYSVSDLVYDVDGLAMVPRDKKRLPLRVRQCPHCNRYYYSADFACSLCERVEDIVKYGKCKNDTETAKARALYKKYARCLGLSSRFAALFSKVKLCVEDSGLLMFIIGKKVYTLDKLSVSESGYISSPARNNSFEAGAKTGFSRR